MAEPIKLTDVFLSGITYVEFIRLSTIKILDVGIKGFIKWMVDEYGFKNNNFKEPCDIRLHWESYTSEPDADYCAYSWVSTLCRKYNKPYDKSHFHCVFEECTADSDDSGFIGDFHVWSNCIIYVNLRDGGLGRMTIQSILDDCQIHFLNYMKELHMDEFVWK